LPLQGGVTLSCEIELRGSCKTGAETWIKTFLKNGL
jgi:hypothetical protein